jgi:hypothetical protein
METKHILTLPETGEEFNRWSAFNPSIALAGDGSGYWMTMRSSNYILSEPRPRVDITIGDFVETRVWLAKMSDDAWNMESYARVDVQADPPLKRGAEDPRLYWRDGGFEMIATVLDAPHVKGGVGRMTRLSLDHHNYTAQLLEVYPAPPNRQLRVEKNWMRTVDGSGNFDFIYGPNSVVQGKKFKSVGNTDGLPPLRGGTQLLTMGDETYIALAHVTHEVRLKTPVYSANKFSVVYPTTRYYVHRFVKYNIDGKIIGWSDEFRLGSYPIEYAAGMVQVGDHFIISYGVEDKSSCLARIPVSDVLENICDIT